MDLSSVADVMVLVSVLVATAKAAGTKGCAGKSVFPVTVLAIALPVMAEAGNVARFARALAGARLARGPEKLKRRTYCPGSGPALPSGKSSAQKAHRLQKSVRFFSFDEKNYCISNQSMVQ